MPEGSQISQIGSRLDQRDSARRRLLEMGYVPLLLLLLSAICRVGSDAVSVERDDELWTKCSCPDATIDRQQGLAPSARVAYLIAAHSKRTMTDAAYLVKKLIETASTGDIAIILIHIDRRVGTASRDNGAEDEGNTFLYDDSPLRKYVQSCLETPACTRNDKNGNIKDLELRNVTAPLLEVHSHFSPEWSKWSMNDPTLWAMDYLTHYPKLRPNKEDKGWDVFINLSGDTLPVVSAQRISQLFEPRKGPLGNTNFVTSKSCATGLLPTSIFEFPKGTMKRSHYFSAGMPKTLSFLDLHTGEWKEDEPIAVYFGSQWMAITPDFVEYVVRSLDHPNGLGRVLKETFLDKEVLMTDETFFATLLMNSQKFKDTLPKLNSEGALASYPTMRSLRYERMDENLPNAWGTYTSSDSLYDIPPKFEDATNGEGSARPWGPYFLGTYDLGAIRDSGALFIRKVSSTVDENLVNMLPVKKPSGDRLEWNVLPEIRWPKLGVNVRKPFVWRDQEEE